MAKRRSTKHPEMDMVKLRPWREDRDIPSVEESMIPNDFSE